jgi:hypothetical protein
MGQRDALILDCSARNIADDAFDGVEHGKRPNETQAQPPLARASVANSLNCFIKSNVLIATASGWLQRLVRPLAHKQI